MTMSRTHKPLFVLKQHSSAISTCAIHDQGVFVNFMLSGDVDGIVKLWDLELRQVLLSFPAASIASQEFRTEEEVPSTPGLKNEGVLQVGFLSFADQSDSAEKELYLFFYTQCRNQQLYIWKVRLIDLYVSSEEAYSLCPSEARVDLVNTISIPQHGFCTVACICLSSTETQLAIPHDSNGIVSLWNVHTVCNASGACENLQVYCSHSFSSAGTMIKCGTIMMISYRDASFMVVAFESGHVSLVTTYGRQLGVIRTFAETTLSCLWSGNTLFASSAEGRLQCYSVLGDVEINDSHLVCDDCPSLACALLWETTLPKGLGCMAVQGNLIVVGSWDHTLRLFDFSGRVISIFTTHSGAVNQISMVPSKVSSYASFGYDVRRPRWCDAVTSRASGNCGGSGSIGGHVYLFASASGDYTVALWRVDFKALTASAN
uniref:Uncharacterized protein TCIL3000_10_8730 n=1 Tax=Trypanosoma congolense (strain IL3000) TaxID=1068625 RepID=G0UXI0_TRYCI|nr:unnamed protein product [Trypanosoma congolense IL3000]